MSTQQTENKRYLKTDEVAALLNCYPGTVRQMVKDNRIEFVKVGRCLRYPADAIKKMVHTMEDMPS
jgi:excisionase family DNA binding protein